MSRSKIECPNCYSLIEKGDLVWPLSRETIEGLLPGDELPAGECPACGDPVLVSDLDEADDWPEDEDEGEL